MRRFAGFLFYLCLAGAGANEQHFPDRDWSQLQVPGFNIVYPDGLEEEARYVADRLATYWTQMQESMPSDQTRLTPRRIPILLSSPTLISNGMVGLDPFRSVFLNQPNALGGLEWFDMLSVHEGRHLVQFLQPLDTPTGQAAFLFAGEMGPGAILLLFYPQWLLEGDAVAEETRLTHGGRGRVASFELWLRTHELSRERYSYERAMLGTGFESYPYVSPYDLGYFLTTYLRRHYGGDILDRALLTTSIPGRGFSFDGAIHHLTGDNLSRTYQKTMDELGDIWRQQQAALEITEVTSLWQPDTEHWRSLYPIGVESQRVLAVEMDVREGSFLVALENGQPRRLTRLPRSVAAGFYSSAKQRSVSYASGRFCWTEGRSHPRFSMETGRDIHCYEIAADNSRQVTQGGQYTSVALKDDGQTMAAHWFTEQRGSRLVLLDAQGRHLFETELPRRSLAYDLAPNDDGGWVFALLDAEGVRFMEWWPRTGELNALTETVQGEALRSPRWAGDWLLYTSDLSGIDSLWAMHKHNKSRYQISQRPFGSYFVNPDTENQRIVMSDYTVEGHGIVSLPWPADAAPEAGWLAAEQLNTSPTHYIAPLEAPKQTQTATPVGGDVSPYRRATHALDVNYWLVEADNDRLRASVHSNNLLNTLTVDVFAGLHWQDKTPIGGANIQWRRWWPVVNAGVSQTLSEGDEYIDTQGLLSLSLPLQYSQGIQSTVVEPFAGLSLTERRATLNGAEFTSTLASTGLYFRLAREPAIRDLQSPLAITNTLAFDGELESDSVQSYDRLQLNLPGLSANHHLTLTGQWQHRPARFRGNSRLVPPRALQDINPSQTTSTLTANYRFRLGPVDASLGRLWYMRNLELGLDAQLMATDEDSATALGATLAVPSNALRNSLLRLTPSLSLYYRPDRDVVIPVVSVTFGGG